MSINTFLKNTLFLAVIWAATVFLYYPTLKAGFIEWDDDVHLYNNHIEQAKLQLTRTPKKLPVMKINPAIKNIFAFKFEDFELTNYEPHPHIKAEVSL